MTLADAKNNSVELTPDGGIVKLPMSPPKDKKEIVWTRGSNALLHFTAHAYIIKSDKKREHKHSPGCQHHHEKSKMEKMKDMLEAISQKKSPIPEPETKEEPIDPNQKPERTLVSNSREHDPEKPFELRIGYNFSVKAFEICVKSMKVGERARFLCMPQYCEGFVQLEMVLRQEKINKERALNGLPPLNFSGCCANVSQEQLDLQTALEPVYGAPVEFEFELIDVQAPNTFEKQVWEMEPSEKYFAAPKLKDEGGRLFKEGKYRDAQMKYEQALIYLESLNNSATVLDLKKERMDKERDAKKGIVSQEPSLVPKDNVIELTMLEELLKSCRLNRAACQLKQGEYRGAIEQCTDILKQDPNNIKALFRRGQSFLKLGRDLDLAERDFDQVQRLVKEDTPEWKQVQQERKTLEQKLKQHHEKEKNMFSNIFQ